MTCTNVRMHLSKYGKFVFHISFGECSRLYLMRKPQVLSKNARYLRKLFLHFFLKVAFQKRRRMLQKTWKAVTRDEIYYLLSLHFLLEASKKSVSDSRFPVGKLLEAFVPDHLQTSCIIISYCRASSTTGYGLYINNLSQIFCFSKTEKDIYGSYYWKKWCDMSPSRTSSRNFRI